MKDLRDRPDRARSWPRSCTGARRGPFVVAALAMALLLLDGRAHAQFSGPPAAPFILPNSSFNQSTPVYPQQLGQNWNTQYGVCQTQYAVPTGTPCTCTLPTGNLVQGTIGQ